MHAAFQSYHCVTIVLPLHPYVALQEDTNGATLTQANLLAHQRCVATIASFCNDEFLLHSMQKKFFLMPSPPSLTIVGTVCPNFAGASHAKGLKGHVVLAQGRCSHRVSPGLFLQRGRPGRKRERLMCCWRRGVAGGPWARLPAPGVVCVYMYVCMLHTRA